MKNVINLTRPSGILVFSGLLGVTIAIVAFTYSAFHPTPVRAATTSYTVLRTESVLDSAGTLKYTNHYVEALRSDGARAFRSTTNDVQKRELYLPNGDHVRVNELIGAKSTFLNEAGSQPVINRDPRLSCASKQELSSGWVVAGRETIGGYLASRLQRVANDRTWTIWYALDLSCAELQLRLDHETGATRQDLASVIAGEPDASLFQLSAALREVPPSQLLVCTHPGCKPPPQAYLQRIDKHYYDLKPTQTTPAN